MWPEFINTLSAWQWAAVLAVPPLLVALYFLKLRRQPVEVPSTFLWQRTVEDLHVNSLWQRLRSSLLLLLQLLLMALVALALVRPGWQAVRLSGGRYIFVIDNSASMSATDVAPSRLAEAKRRAAELIDQMGSGDVAMLISFAGSGRVEQPFTSNRAELRRRLQAIRPTQQVTSLDEALRLASGLAATSRAAGDAEAAPLPAAATADMYIFSDGRCGAATDVSLENLRPYFVPIGQAEVDNLAILTTSTGRRDRSSRGLQVFARLHNYGALPVETPLSLLVDDVLMDANRILLPASESRGVAFEVPELESGVVELRIDRPDDLLVDNRAWTVVEPAAPVRVLLVTPGNEPLELALSTPRARDLAVVSVEPPATLETEAYRRQAAGGAWDLILFDRCRPAQSPQANTWYLGEFPPDDPWQPSQHQELPQIIDINQSHPLTQIVDMGDVLVLEATVPTVPPGAAVLVDSNRGPLLTLAPRDNYQDLVQGFALVGSDKVVTNWAARRSFPVFVLNVLEYFQGGGARAQGSVRPGETISLRLDTPEPRVAVTAPGGQTTTLARGAREMFTFSGTDQAGLYSVAAAGRGVARFAVNLFDQQESDLGVRADAPLTIGHAEIGSEAAWQTARYDLWRWLLLGALVVLLFEWYIYNRRVYL